MRNKKIRITGLLMVLAAPLLSVTFGQAPPSSQEQIALQIISQRFGIPINELAVINKVTLGEEGITRIKILHVPQVKIYIVNLDAQNREVDDATMQQILAARRGQGFVGKQQRALYNAVRTGNPIELIKIGIWLKQTPNPPRLDRDAPPSVRQAQLEVIRNYHAALRRPVEEFVARNQGRVLYGSRLAPLVFVQVPKGLILGSAQTPSLELRPDVETLYLSREYKPALNHSASAINADNFWNAGTTGSGIKTAVIEPFGIAYAHPNLPDGIYCNPSNVIVDDHPTKVAGVVNSYHPTYVGIAFGAPAVLSGNSLSSEEPQIISCSDWAIDQGANVLNYSLDLNPYGEDGQMGALRAGAIAPWLLG